MHNRRNNLNQLAKFILEKALKETEMANTSILFEMPDNSDVRKMVAASLTQSITGLIASGNSEEEAVISVSRIYNSMLSCFEKQDRAIFEKQVEAIEKITNQPPRVVDLFWPDR
jgi:hypothetical protein